MLWTPSVYRGVSQAPSAFLLVRIRDDVMSHTLLTKNGRGCPPLVGAFAQELWCALCRHLLPTSPKPAKKPTLAGILRFPSTGFHLLSSAPRQGAAPALGVDGEEGTRGSLSDCDEVTEASGSPV